MQSIVCLTGLGNTRRFYCNSNSRWSELQGIGRILSPLELYCKELIKYSEVQKRIGKSGQHCKSNKRAILSSKQLSLCMVDRQRQIFCVLFWSSRVRYYLEMFKECVLLSFGVCLMGILGIY